MERGGTQGIQFIVQVILARLLLPEDFGAIAIITVFISLAQVFVQSGFNTALVQNKEANEVDFSSVFYLSLAVAAILYVIIYFSAPYIANFYEQPILTSALRVLSITLFIGAFNSIQNAFVARNMLFKRLFVSSLGAIIISGAIGIITAYNGLGVWALVAQQLSNQLSISIILWFTVKWRPQLVFSFRRVKTLFEYGSKLLVSSLIDTFYRDLRTLIIGRMYTPEMLGFYNRGQQFPNVIVTNIDGSIQSVMLPVFSAEQDNIKRVKGMMRRAIVTSSFLIFPMMIGMAVVAEPLVEIVLTDKWLPAVPFLQIFCITYSLIPIHTANLQAIKAMGRSDIFLRLEIIKKVIGLIVLVTSLPFGVYAIALGQVFSGIISSFINAYPNKQLLEYSYKEQWVDIIPSLLIAIAMGAIVYSINYLEIVAWKLLILQVCVGAVIYFSLAKIFKLESLSYLITTLKQLLNNRKG
jgi:O-antigen/teichoic acid export membrane protein